MPKLPEEMLMFSLLHNYSPISQCVFCLIECSSVQVAVSAGNTASGQTLAVSAGNQPSAQTLALRCQKLWFRFLLLVILCSDL